MEEQLHQALAELEQNLSNLKGYVEYIEQAKENSAKITSAAIEVVNSLKNSNEGLDELKINVGNLIEKIAKVDFPQRLDKLDVTVSTINQNISNLQSRLEKISNDLDLKLTDNKNTIISSVNDSSKELRNTLSTIQVTLNHHSKDIKFIKSFSIISSSLFFIFLAAIVFKLFFT